MDFLGKLKKYRITLPFFFLVIFQSGLAVAETNTSATNKKTNVILITVDTFRPDHLGFAGYYRKTAPFLDSIAKKGIVFENTISSASWTSPGLISILTGLYPHVHGVDARSRSLLPNTNTIFKIFKKNGYHVPNLSYLTVIPNFSNLGLESPENADRGKNNGLYENELVSWLKKHKDKSFMAWYHYRKLHLPYVASSASTSSTEDDKELDSPSIKIIKKQTVIPYKSISFSKDERKKVNELYDNQLADFDAFLKNIVKELGQLKLSDNTLIVISADHAEELFEHDFVGHASTAIHATLYDELIRIPLVFYLPSQLKQGISINKQVRQIDIMPTILDIAGLPVPKDIQGVSLLPTIEHKDATENTAISESVIGGYQTPESDQNKKIYSIRTRGWKLIREKINNKDFYQLFNLKDDPHEKNNLVTKEPKQFSILKEQLEDEYRKLEMQRLKRLSLNNQFKLADIPTDSKLEKASIISPKQGAVISMDKTGSITLKWVGDSKAKYLLEYDIGKGVRNVTGKMVIQGTSRTFGPFPEEIYTPLPAWNPFKIRVSPYGVEKYRSQWVEFTIDVKE